MLGPQIARKPVGGGGGVSDNVYGHSRTRTVSSNNPHAMHSQSPQHLSHPHAHYGHNRRSPSVNTFSTSSSIPPPAAYRKSSGSDLHRSESNRSAGTSHTTNSSSGYVALLRKQKATVWCDRAQYEDPRLVAQQRAAKKKATLEVTGGGRAGTPGSRTNTGITVGSKVGAKIRHHGKTPTLGLTPGENHVGVGGVPLRLSATEVEAESSDEDKSAPLNRLHHRRTGSSGRSSIASGQRAIPYRSSGGHGSLNSLRRSPGDTPERSGSIVEDPTGEAIDVVQQHDDAASTKARSTRSGSSAERADNVGELSNAPRLASNSLMHSALTREKSVKNPEELRRRGSVDERTTTFTSQRLYIANPD